MVNNKSFFDTHSHVHAYNKDPEFYLKLVQHLSKISLYPKILDLGCGNGSFIKMVTEEGLKGEIVGVDISTSMLQLANEDLKYDDVHLIAADGFLLPFSTNCEFDIIHMDSVLHHLIGKTRSASRALAERLIGTLLREVSAESVIAIEEMLYESHVVSSITSSFIFYGLKLINFLKLDLSRISKDIIPGLEVNFYTEKELVSMLNKFGTVEIIKISDSRMSILQRIFILKKFGHISLLLKISHTHPRS